MHLGLIGGIGPAATGFYYRGLVAASRTSGKPYRMTIDHADNAGLLANFYADRRDEQGAIFAGHIKAMARAGAQVAAVTALAGHYCIAETAAKSPIPVLSALDVVRDGLEQAGLARIGLLGAGRVMQSGLYGALDGIDQLHPEDVEGSGKAYVAMAQRGNCEAHERTRFFEDGARMIDQGAQAVVLAGTDLFLAFDGHDPGYPVVDCARLHIDALAKIAEKDG